MQYITIKKERKAMIKDSGSRREFKGGAVRDIQEGKGRCDLMPLSVVGEYLNYEILDLIEQFKTTSDNEKLFLALDLFAEQNKFDKFTMLLEVSKHFEEGAKKYGENNWQKGILTHSYIDSAVRHYLKYLRGDTDEPHDRAFVWNLLCCIWTCENKPDYNEYITKTCENRCVSCGEIIPEGLIVCPDCALGDKLGNIKN